MNDPQALCENVQTVSPVLSEDFELKIGGTTYIVTSKYKENSREGLLDKIWRLMEYDVD